MVGDKLLQTYGPTALVTGASEGIGEAFSRRLARAGFDLVIVARRQARLDALAESLSAEHAVEVRPMALDLADITSTAVLAEHADRHEVGLFVACAGFGTSGPLMAADRDAELSMIDLNCRAVVDQSQALGRLMARRGRGGIILMSSLLAFQGVPRAANYAATKAFVQVFAEGLRAELAPSGVDVVACAPGPVRSGFAARANMQMNAAIPAHRIPGPTLRALGRAQTARPGLLTKLLSYSLAPLPRMTRSRILAAVMNEMTRHQNADSGD